MMMNFHSTFTPYEPVLLHVVLSHSQLVEYTETQSMSHWLPSLVFRLHVDRSHIRSVPVLLHTFDAYSNLQTLPGILCTMELIIS